MILTKRQGLISLSMLMIILFLLFMSVVFGAGSEAEHPDVFAHKNIKINADQIIERLMVADGNAIVAGKVTEGIIVVDGDVTIESEAIVNERVVVIGGDITIHPGAKVKEKPWVIPPLGYSLLPLVVGSLLLLGLVSLLLLPIMFWLIGHFFKKTSWYPPFKKQFLLVQQRWPALYIAASLGISAFMLSLFTALAWETIFRNAMVVFDNAFIWLIRYFASPGLDKVMIFITDIGFGTSYMVIVAICLLLLVYLRRWREVSGLAICLIGGAALNFWLKFLFHRSRPDLFRVVQETGYSFPSGHVIASMCFYGMGAFLMMRMISSWRGRLTVATLAGVLIIAIGISRIYLGVHYPTDVLAGFTAGSMWVFFCISLLMWWERRRMTK